MEKEWLFDRRWTRDFTKVRQDFVGELLDVLRRQMQLDTAIDTGCGVGDFTKFLSDKNFRVTGVDGRQENAKEASTRYPQIVFHAADIEELSAAEMGKFDLALCFGLLYHLENPFRAIRILNAITDKLLVIETMIAPGFAPSLELVDEGRAEDQGLNYVAFYPTEACLVKMLYRAGFSFVYGFENLPRHDLFHAGLWRRQQRTMLVASRSALTAPGLKLLPNVKGSWEILLTSRERFRQRLEPLVGVLRRFSPKALLFRHGARKT